MSKRNQSQVEKETPNFFESKTDMKSGSKLLKQRDEDDGTFVPEINIPFVTRRVFANTDYEKLEKLDLAENVGFELGDFGSFSMKKAMTLFSDIYYEFCPTGKWSLWQSHDCFFTQNLADGDSKNKVNIKKCAVYGLMILAMSSHFSAEDFYELVFYYQGINWEDYEESVLEIEKAKHKKDFLETYQGTVLIIEKITRYYYEILCDRLVEKENLVSSPEYEIEAVFEKNLIKEDKTFKMILDCLDRKLTEIKNKK